MQRITISELTKIAIVHLYSQGYTDAKLVDFNLKLTNPSTIFEEERCKNSFRKIKYCRDMIDAKMFSKDWVYDKIFGLAEDEVNEIRSNFVDDAKEFFRLESIQNEGNDPADPTQNQDTEEDEGWGFGDFKNMSEEEKEEALKQKEKKKKRNEKMLTKNTIIQMKNQWVVIHLEQMKERVNGRDWGDSPLKLESDLAKLDSFLKSKSDQPTQIKPICLS